MADGTFVSLLHSIGIFPAQNGEFLRNVVTQLRHLRRRRHGCPTLREPEDTECAP